MKSLQLLLLIISSCLTLSAVAREDEPQWIEKKIVISGNVVNFSNHQNNRTIQIIFRDFFEVQKTYTATINQDGTFKFSFLLPNAQEFFLEYGSLTTLYCSPGDSLSLEIDADIWSDPSNTKPHGEFYVKVNGGTAAELNKNILKFLNVLPTLGYFGDNDLNAIKTKSPKEYREYISSREAVYRGQLKKFNKVSKTDKTFRTWVDKRLKFESWNDLMRFAWYNPHLNGIKRDSLKLPDDYYSFLENYDMSDRDIKTINHVDFLHELIRYSFERNIDLTVPFIECIKRYTSGFTQELALTYMFVNSLKAQHLNLVEDEYKQETITDPYLRKLINSKVEALKVSLANQNTKGANLLDVKSSITTELLQTISTKYKGKVIFIDFWGPWCAPCMQEMPSSKEVQHYFEGKGVVFLFLANRTKDDSWRATIANNGLTGEHLNLTNDQFNILSSQFDISGVPHYTLIDKKGDIVLKKAPRPSDKKTLIREIEKLLK
jgi:thiol-disulfide isomerase/thioredoxin